GWTGEGNVAPEGSANAIVARGALLDRIGSWPEFEKHRAGWRPIDSRLRPGLFEIPIDRLISRDRIIFSSDASHLLTILAQEPDLLREIPPRTFEEVVAELLSKHGFDVRLTPYSRDRGVDIVAARRIAPVGLAEKYLVECKRYARHQKVGIGVVHRLIGAASETEHTGLVIVTTSTF